MPRIRLEQQTPRSSSRMVALVPLLAVIAVAVAIRFVMGFLEPYLSTGGFAWLPDYGPWAHGATVGDLGARLLWLVGDFSEGAFIKSVPASIGLMVGYAVAALLERRGSSYAGTGVAGASRVWMRVAATSVAATAISVTAYGWLIRDGWAPTFVTVLLAQIMVGFWGASASRCVTIAVLVGLVPCPVSIFLMNVFSTPAGLPAFAAVGLGMAIATIVMCELARILPWMGSPEPAFGPAPKLATASTSDQRRFFLVHVFAGISDLPATGSSLAGVGMVAGTLIGWALNPAHAVYGSGRTANLLMCLVICAALAVFVHFPTILSEGASVTFTALLCVGALVITYENSWLLLVPAMLVAALVVPWLVRLALMRLAFARRWPGSVVCQTVTALVVTVLGFAARLMLGV